MAVLYRKKYMISIYDQYDQLITVLDNHKDFASFFNKNPEQARYILAKLFSKKQKSFYYRKKQYTAAFIQD